MRISVLLADDHVVVREGLRALIQTDKEIVVAGEASDGLEAVQLARRLMPDVILMDIAMPRLDGFAATREILEEMPLAKIVFLSSYAEPEYVKQATELGAAGFLIKQTESGDVIKAIHEARKGNAYFSPCISERMVRNHRLTFLDRSNGMKVGDQLTSRESEVLHAIAESKGNGQIALELGVSVKTVEKHRQNVMKKLDIHDVAGLTRYAMARDALSSTELRPCSAPHQVENEVAG